MPFCSQCGNQVGGRDVYCGRCGARQPMSSAPPPDPLSQISPRTASICCYIPGIGWIASIIVLASQKFDVVFLDHDLENHVDGFTDDISRKTGYDVALFIKTVLPLDKRPNQIVIHSMNPVGAFRMEELLKDLADVDVRRVSFANLLTQLVI